ncbi:hypothetical protein [Terrarubrum flagellatum]|uniref:hypothetical protein n=1 Tax=Terrirubrum flagellatum TaxID=2895980 RepID=UPI003145019A
MNRLRLSLAIAFSVLTADLASAQAQRNLCRFPGIRFFDGTVAVRRILTTPNSVCAFNSHSGGALLGHQVTVPPKLGVFGRANEAQSAYRVGAALGTDYFEYQVRWEWMGRVNSMTIRNYVRIVPPPQTPTRVVSRAF